ncbi:MAG: fibronectin type III domain-containing protein, partial [Vicinamibacterales bacterium]
DPAAVPVAKPTAGPAAASKPDAPVNPAPLAAPKLELADVAMGMEQCFAVRAVRVVQNVAIESDASPTTCVTPRDVFPPAAPQNLGLLLLDGAIELVWDAGTEADIAGYTILRGDMPGDTLRPLTPSPIRESTFRDTTVKPGARYLYAVVAVDKAGNASPASAPVEGTAR